MHLEDCLTLILMQLATNCVQFYSQSSPIVVTVRGPPLAESDAPLTSERVTWSEDRREASVPANTFLQIIPVHMASIPFIQIDHDVSTQQTLKTGSRF